MKSILIIALASIISLTLSYFKLPSTILQSFTGALFIVLIVALTRIFYKSQKTTLTQQARLALLLTSSLVTQLLVLSTGGLYSPLLILIHIFTLGASFLVSLNTALTFLTLSVGILIANNIFKPELSLIFTSDPWSATLYLITFLIIIPLSHLLAKSYFLKDTISKVLSEYIQIEQLRSQSILTSLNDMVIIIDDNFKIISFNAAAEKALGLKNTEVTGREVISVLPIKDSQGNNLSVSTLYLDQAINDGVSRIVEDLKIIPYGEIRPRPVRISVRPIIDNFSHTAQIILIISTLLDQADTKKRHLSLLEAESLYHLRLDEIKNNLGHFSPSQLRARVELLEHTLGDLILATEIQDHPIKPKTGMENLMTLSERLVSKKASFAQIFAVPLNFNRPIISNINMGINTYLTVPVDINWISVIVEKLIEMSVLLSSEAHAPVEVTVGPNAPSRIEVTSSCRLPENTQPQQLLSMYYPTLNRTPLRLGSGLEGFIAATVVSELGINLDINIGSTLKFTLILGPDDGSQLTQNKLS